MPEQVRSSNLPVQSLPGNSEFTGFVLAAVQADVKNNLAVRTVGFFIQLTIIAIRFLGVLAHCFEAIGISLRPGFFPELLHARIAQGIEAGFAFFFQGIASPVQVGHDGIAVLIPCQQESGWNVNLPDFIAASLFRKK
jgi:hypothetical protein